MLQLRVLGAFDVRAEGGQPLRPLLHQPKRAALLAYLAAAAPLGTFHRRDILVALFWPELDESHARGALNTALKFLRQAAGHDVILSRGASAVGLDPSRLDADVASFALAVDEGRLEAALELYRGDLLEGFHIAEAPAFEEWLERERTRLRTRAARAATELAARYEAAGNPVAGIPWARHAAALAPDDELAVRRIIRLLDSAGDRAGALRVYEEFERRLASEFESEPAAETRALVELIRVRTVAAEGVPVSDTPRAATERHGTVGDRLPGESATAVPSLQSATLPRASTPPLRGRPAGRRWRRVATGAALIAAVGVAGLGLYRGHVVSATSASVPDRPTVLLVPFAVEGPPGSDYLAGVVTTLLSHALDGTSALSVVDQNLLREHLARDATSPPTLDETARLARSAGAQHLVVGDVVAAGETVSLSARVYSSGGSRLPLGEPMSFRGRRDQLPDLVVQLARDLLGQLPLGPDVRLAELGTVNTRSFEALKAYADAQPLYRRGAYDSAHAALLRAVRHDSLFALAWYQLAWTQQGFGGTNAPVPAIETAMRLRDGLPRRDRLLVEGLHAFSVDDPELAERRALDAMAHVRDHYETWLLLGRARFAMAWRRGSSSDTARTAFERASLLAPDISHVLHFRVFQELPLQRWDAADSLARLAYARSLPNVAASVRAATAFGRGDTAAQRRVLAGLSGDPDHFIWNSAAYIALYTDDLRGAMKVATLLSQPTRSTPTRAGRHLADALLELARGRPSAADAALARFATHAPEAALAYRAWFASFPAFEVSDSAIRAVRDEVRRWPHGSDTVHVAGWWLDMPWSFRPQLQTYLLGLLAARLGESVDALAHAQALEKANVPADSSNLLHELAAEIRALVAIERGDFDAALDLVDDAAIRLRPPLHRAMPIARRPLTRWLRAEMLTRSNRGDDALGWYSVFRQAIGVEFIFIAPAHQRMGRVHEEAGRIAEARAHYTRFLLRWQDAEPSQQALVTDTRRRLARLGTGP